MTNTRSPREGGESSSSAFEQASDRVTEPYVRRCSPAQRMLQVGMIALVFKALILMVVLYAMFSSDPRKSTHLWLGLEVMPINDTIRRNFHVHRQGGLLVNAVLENSPAEKTGLKRGDVVLNADNTAIFAVKDLENVLQNRKAGDPITIVYLRNGKAYAAKSVLDYSPLHLKGGSEPSLHHYEVSLRDLLGLPFLGLLAGILSGMIGCGGGVLKVSLLIIFFGFEIFLAKVVSLISCGFMSISSSHKYLKYKCIDRDALKYMIPFAILGTLLGVAVSMALNRHVLETALAVFLIYAALDIFWEIWRSGTEAQRKRRRERPVSEVPAGERPLALALVGLPTGFFSSVLGITGGIVGTPVQKYLLRLPINTCIANTLVMVIFVSFLGGALLLFEGLARDYFSIETFLKVAACIIPGSIIGGQIGSTLNKRLPTNYVKLVYAVIVLFIACKVIS